VGFEAVKTGGQNPWGHALKRELTQPSNFGFADPDLAVFSPRYGHGSGVEGLNLATSPVDDLLDLGRRFDQRAGGVTGEVVSVLLARRLLKIRDRGGIESALEANTVQRAFVQSRGQHNIVVKARQMGMTTWVAGRFFLKTITAPGVLTVQVAQTREAAEGIFRVVQRFWECLPEDMRLGCLRRSRANVGQMIFPELDSEFRIMSACDESAGRGMTIQNLHCSEVSRWPGDAAETLAGLRAALAPMGEMVLESTPNGAYGCFYEEWKQAAEKGVVRHFYPWWLEKAYRSAAVLDIREDESALMAEHGLDAQQIGFRRGLEASYRGLRRQEFAENAETCFRAVGECCFDVEAVEERLAALRSPMATRRGGRWRSGCLPWRIRSTWLRWIRQGVDRMAILPRCRWLRSRAASSVRSCSSG
jgi:hypothetical protein